jgi:hypothetical protein
VRWESQGTASGWGGRQRWVKTSSVSPCAVGVATHHCGPPRLRHDRLTAELATYVQRRDEQHHCGGCADTRRIARRAASLGGRARSCDARRSRGGRAAGDDTRDGHAAAGGPQGTHPRLAGAAGATSPAPPCPRDQACPALSSLHRIAGERHAHVEGHTHGEARGISSRNDPTAPWAGGTCTEGDS